MKKIYIFLIAISVLLLFVFIFLSVNKDNSEYLIFDNVLNLKYEDGKFVEVNYDDLPDSNYASFSNREFIGYYSIYGKDQNNEFYMTNDSSDDAYTFDHPYLFVTNGVKVLEYQTIDANVSDLSYITYDLDKYYIESIDDLDVFKKVNYDVDGDGSVETIFIASYFDIDDNNSFSVIFLVKNNKVFLIGESNLFSTYDEEDSFSSIDNYQLEYLMEIDGSVKMIVGMESTDVTYYQVYSFDDTLVQEYGG